MNSLLQGIRRALNPRPVVAPTRDSAEIVADVRRELERDVDFETRPLGGGWMIARIRKDGVFHSWVEG
jgi:hypothetical protein